MNDSDDISCTSKTSCLADAGIANYELGKYQKAEQCFREALCFLDGGSCPQETEDITCVMSLDRCISSSYDLPSSSGSTASNFQNNDKTSQEEYDEGMRVYNDILPINNNVKYYSSIASQEYKSCALLYNIAQTHVNRNQYETAKKYFDLSLSRSSTVSLLLSDKSVVIKILHNLGYCSYRLGRNDDAMKYYQRSLSMNLQGQRCFDDDDAELTHDCDLAASLNSVAVILFHSTCSSSQQATEKSVVANIKCSSTKGTNCERVMTMFRNSLSIYRASRFDAHGEAADIDEIQITATIATVLNNIGRVHYICEEFEQALVVYDEALRLRRSTLGDNSIDCGATIYNKAQTLYQLGQLQESMKYYSQFLRIAQLQQQSKNLSKDNTSQVKETRDVAIVYKCMAEIHHQNRENKLAMSLYTKALRAMRASMGDFHPEVASTLNKLGNLSYEMEDYDAAMAYYEKGLIIERAALPPNHPHIVITLTNIAHIHKHGNNFAGALEMYRQVHELQVREFGPQSIEAAGTLSSIGLMQYHLKHYDNAFESYQEALRVRREHYGSDEHPDVASTLNSVGLVLFKQEIFDLAKCCFMESLRIRQKVLGPSHRDVAVLWYNIATICFETGEDDLAIKYYKETLRVERESLGPDHPDTVLTLQHIGNVFHNHGDLESALPFFEEALDVERRRQEVSTNAIGKILNMIGNIRLQEGNIKEMMDCYIEASRLYDSNPDQAETLVIAGYNFYGLSKISPPCAPVA